jgi:hypothetical protein
MYCHLAKYYNIPAPSPSPLQSCSLRTMSELKAIGLVEMEDFKEEGQNNYSKRIILNPRFDWFLSDPMITKIIPHTRINSNPELDQSDSSEEEQQCLADDGQENTFWQVYDELQQEEELSNDNYSDVDKNTISGKKLEERLISTGQFYNGDAIKMIKDMVKAGKLKEVMLDTYMRLT